MSSVTDKHKTNHHTVGNEWQYATVNVLVLLYIFVAALRRLSVRQRSPNCLGTGQNSRSYHRQRAAVFVYRKNMHNCSHVCRVYCHFSFSVSCLQCDLRNCFFCCIIVVVLASIFDAAIRNTESIVQMCVWDSVSTLGFAIFHIRQELFAKISISLCLTNHYG